MHVLVSTLSVSFYLLSREMCLFASSSFLFLFTELGENRSYVAVNGSRVVITYSSRQCTVSAFKANSKLEIWPRLISTWRQNGALLRDRFRLCDSKARLSAIKSSRPTEDSVGSLSYSVWSAVCTRWKSQNYPLCARKMPAGDTSRLSAPMKQPWCCGRACNRFNTTTEIRSIHQFARNFKA